MVSASRRSLLIASCVVASAASAGLGVAPAAAAGKAAPSKIEILGTAFVDPDSELPDGAVTSSQKRCIANRKVTVYFAGSSGPFVKVDTDRTTTHGGWAGLGPASGTSRIKAKVAKSHYGPKHHRKTCAAATSEVLHLA